MIRAFVLLAGVTAAACTEPTSACMNVAVPALAVHAVSAVTSENLDARATLRIIELQAPFDTISGVLSNSPPSLPLTKTADRTGRFQVRIEVPGFSSWEQIIAVPADACNEPITVDVTARLTPVT
jgi:hypothetical protein